MLLRSLVVLLAVAAAARGQECGPSIGECPIGNCCSRFGFCGNSQEHCAPALGCVSQCTPSCGDSVCDAASGETCTSCSADCGFCQPTSCGNGKVPQAWSSSSAASPWFLFASGERAQGAHHSVHNCQFSFLSTAMPTAAVASLAGHVLHPILTVCRACIVVGVPQCELAWLETGESCGNCPADCGPCQTVGGVISSCQDPNTISLSFNGAPSYLYVPLPSCRVLESCALRLAVGRRSPR